MPQLPVDPGLPRAARLQVESDPAALRRELEAARQALRCRQTDVKLSKRLEQKELEIQSWKTLREQQLSQIMRALMMLEARLRREQRTIRCQLGERDAVIRAQQLEIARLKKLLNSEPRQEEVKPVKTSEVISSSAEFEYDCDVKPDLISSLGITHFRRNPDKSLTPTTTDNEDSQSNLDSLQLSFYEVGSQPESLMSNLSTQSCNGDVSEDPDATRDSTEYTRMSPPKQTQDLHWNESNSVRTTNNNNYFTDLKTTRCQDLANNMKKLEIKVNLEPQYPQKNVLSPVKEESSINLISACNSPVRCTPCEEQTTKSSQGSPDPNYKDCKPSPSTLLQEVRISGRNEYEDNPVLSCVNQILLRDQEEFLEEQRALRIKEQEKSKKEAEAKLNNKKLTKSTENLSLLNEQIIVQHSPVKNKVYSPLNSVSPNHVTEQVFKHSVPQEEDNYNSITKLTSPKKRTSPKDSLKVKSVPPALPPKPQRLLFSKTLDQKTLLNTILPQIQGDESNGLDLVKHRASLPNPSADNELYVISNSAIDDELLQQLQNRRIKSCSELPVSLNKSKPLTQSRESIYTPVLSHPTHKPQVKSPPSVSPQKDKPTEQNPSPKKTPLPRDEEGSRVTTKNSSPKKIMSTSNCIKVATPVSSLLNSVDVESSPSEDKSGKKTSPSVSQIVRRFEDLGTKVGKDSSVERTDDNSNSLQKNFEEFRLDECDMDTLCGDDRPEGDGAEVRLNGTAAVLEARISYENFLEATGLSQKSIVTPSRLFSNHKSVMKPKDVKHRSRVKAAAGVVDRCNNNTPGPGGSIVRYWTEPFL